MIEYESVRAHMKITRLALVVLFSAALFVTCGEEEAVDISGEYVIYTPEVDPYDLHNKLVEITGEPGSYFVETQVFGGEEEARSPLDADETPYIVDFERMDYMVTWVLTPSDSGFEVIWRDNTNVQDVRFELRPYTEEEQARVAREKRAEPEQEAQETKTDLSEFIVEPQGALEITVEELVNRIHQASDEEFQEFSQMYKYKTASTTANVESITEKLGYESLYEIVTYRDFDNNSWNKNTLRLTLYTDDSELAQSMSKGSQELSFVITSYKKDKVKYVIAIDGTLLAE